MWTNLWYFILVGTVPNRSLKKNLFALVLRFGAYAAAMHGYPFNIKFYQGKEKKLQDQLLESRVIKNMVDVILANSSSLLHELYFNNFFTSYSLISDLAKIDVQATGTIRENRTAGANQKMKSSKQLQKQERGCFEYCFDGTLYIAKWHDNSVLTIASNWKSHIPVHNVRRRVKKGIS